ncbi:MAG: hypothetical protein WCU88_00430 [Elusimicrobiota bacterium]
MAVLYPNRGCFALLIALTFFLSAAARAQGLVAQLGEKGRIGEEDLAQYSASESCYGPEAVSSRKAGFMTFLESEIMEEVLRRESGPRLKDEDYAAEVRRVDKESRAPDILACIKKSFGSKDGIGFPSSLERRRYERVFLRKHMIPAAFYRFLRYDPKVQAQAYALRDNVFQEAVNGASFADLASRYKVEYATKAYREEEPKADGKAGMPMAWTPFEKKFIDENLRELSPGKVLGRVIEGSEDLRIVRLLDAREGRYEFEWLIIRKRGVQDYFSSVPKIKTVIHDPGLRDWISGISGNPLLKVLSIR